AQFREHPIRAGSVMNGSERVHEVISSNRHGRGKLFAIRALERYSIGHGKFMGPELGKLERFWRQIDRRDIGAGTREIDGIGADAAADFQNALAVPARKIGKGGDVRLDEVLARFDLVEVIARANWLGRVANVAGT